MNIIVYIISAAIIISASAFALYIYQINRKTESERDKKHLRIRFEKKYFVISLISTFVACGIFLYSYLWKDIMFLQAFMNAEVILWLFTIGYIDFKEKIIPNEMILTAIVFWLILFVVEVFISKGSLKQILMYSLAGAGICGGILFLVAIVVKSALGMGDVKLFFSIGLLYGVSNTYSILLFSIFIMAIVSIFLLLIKKVNRKTAVPMAPFVAIGFLINVILGM